VQIYLLTHVQKIHDIRKKEYSPVSDALKSSRKQKRMKNDSLKVDGRLTGSGVLDPTASKNK